jgi:peptidoglycan/LPS O-acetylase OafA/YrhL
MKHLPVLDGLRGVAILMVVCFHLWQQSWLDLGRALHLPIDIYFFPLAGFLGVELFFFLSGFCLALTPMTSGRVYFLRRAWKIVPSYLLALVVAFAFSAHDRNAFQLLTHLTFTHSWFFETHYGISGVLWSLAVEVQFYCLLPLIAPTFRRHPFLLFGGLALVAFLWRLYVSGRFGADSHALTMALNQLPGVLDLFGLGMLAAWAVQKLHEREKPLLPTWAWCLLAIAALCGFVLLLKNVQSITYTPGGIPRWQADWRFVFGLDCTLLAVASTFAPRLWQRVIANPVLTFFAAVSYNWYLWHAWIAVTVREARWIPSPLANPQEDFAWQPRYYATVFFGSLALATLITYAVERPLLKWSRRKKT